ncbi:Rec8 like protein-domain-containing protein [Annulohypoxylon truncatum]|uniref:Rec8 like protein-domain-containing protein n=1 Tax=Annulohypoxylon truncatum TaxID=327061 RepID=UPI002008D533|nr:Rec8 like protein-domain-containing protein [Annulohypoxylon truncatum]KAI1211939.1 Rec8 like protein-domain-containing protein [Annulohypoxylon truncatum]
MFYSHEILMSRQYGVATIWLVATVGTGIGARKKVTRKAIQEVDVQKACGKIIEPGAPVALRLQGQLLYGVSRVYSQQCGYMLSDLQKIHTHMHMFFTKFGENQLDPEAGQARPENLLILNDPDFVPDMILPKFDLDALVASSQATQKTSSQMSPLDSTILASSHHSQSPAHGFDIRLDLHDSPSPGPAGSPFGFQGFSSTQKPAEEHRMLPEEDIFGGAGDWGMDVDEHGNIIESAEPAIVQDEFDLPPFPAMEGDIREHVGAEQQRQPTVDDQGEVIMMDDAQQAGEIVVANPPSEHHSAFLSDDHRQHQAPSRRKRKPRMLHADEETQVSRAAMNEWQEDYLENCGGPKIRATGAAKAKANAMLLTFGLGLGNIGQNIGVPGMVHPLALDFSGDSLFTAITGLTVPDLPRGRRRSASESIEDDEEQGRRVRPRLEGDDVQLGRSLEGDAIFAHDGQQIHDSPEVGREAQAAMSDHLSSALNMPWNRGSSHMPGSSLRGSAQKGRIPSSPLAGRGNLQDIVRFSDAPSLDDGGFDLGGLPSDNDVFDEFHLSPQAQKQPSGQGQGEQKVDSWPTLDIEGQNFLSFMHATVRENGERRLDEDFDIDRRWVAFDDVFVPRETNRATASQAFFHVLSLATKARLDVQQDSEPEVAFGGIWVGVKMGDVDVDV